MIRAFIELQRRWSERFDSRVLPAHWLVDGNLEYVTSIVPKYLRPGVRIYDFGGGRTPLVKAETKRTLQLEVVGVDIDSVELASAPEECYDRRDCADVTAYLGNGDGDLAICQALLEHVNDTGAAVRSIASALRPGGLALVFVPCRNAVFARLNLLLPQSLKRELLFRLYPTTRNRQGFRAYYDRCTPASMTAIAAALGLEVVESRHYFQSKYFSCFFPAHVAWRVLQRILHCIWGTEMAETFTLVLRKPAVANAPPSGRECAPSYAASQADRG